MSQHSCCTNFQPNRHVITPAHTICYPRCCVFHCVMCVHISTEKCPPPPSLPNPRTQNPLTVTADVLSCSQLDIVIMTIDISLLRKSGGGNHYLQREAWKSITLPHYIKAPFLSKWDTRARRETDPLPACLSLCPLCLCGRHVCVMCALFTRTYPSLRTHKHTQTYSMTPPPKPQSEGLLSHIIVSTTIRH